MKIESIPPAPLSAQPPTASARVVADKLEGAFLEEMMKHAFPKPESGSFSGGVGEDQFGSFLAREHAAMLARALDLGLAPRPEGGAHG